MEDIRDGKDTTEGECTAWRVIRGCVTPVEDGKALGTLCID
jgi:hypothetical protein